MDFFGSLLVKLNLFLLLLPELVIIQRQKKPALFSKRETKIVENLYIEQQQKTPHSSFTKHIL